MWALSLPVRRHWSMNIPWLRFITWPATTIVIGTVTRATSASCHEIENISTTTKTTVRSEVSSWLIVCCKV